MKKKRKKKPLRTLESLSIHRSLEKTNSRVLCRVVKDQRIAMKTGKEQTLLLHSLRQYSTPWSKNPFM